MTSEDNKRIAVLTTGAIKTTTESAIKAMLAAVEAAEEKTREMREATERYIVDFERVTSELASTVNTHVVSCQAAIDSFQEHHLKILNHEAQVPAPAALPPPSFPAPTRPLANFDEEFKNVRRVAPPSLERRK